MSPATLRVRPVSWIIIRSTVRSFFRNESGATAIEYSLIAALMAIAVIACLTAFGPQMLEAFNRMGADMATPPDVTAE
jgi:pilus assembly protein Flp/PilA